MTYKELKEALNNLSQEQLNMTVTVWDGWCGEYVKVEEGLELASETDEELLTGHPFMMIN